MRTPIAGNDASWLCSGKGSRLLVETVQKALSHVNVDIDSDEVECLLANLIFKVRPSRRNSVLLHSTTQSHRPNSVL